MTDNLKRSLESNGYPVGNWVSIGHPAVVEVNAALEFDFVLIDTEHTTMTLETVEHLVRAVECGDGDTEAIVRVPDDDPSRIKRVLDIGAAGIMVPMIETAEEARELVEAVHYPPEGIRGIAGGRAAKYGLDFQEYVENADDSILTFVQIETETGLANVENIAAVDGIDSLFVGPADLSGALGVLGQHDPAKLQEAIDRVLDAGEASEVPVGTLTVDPDQIDGRVDEGFDFLIVGKDTVELAASSREAKERYENAVARYAESVPAEFD